MSDSQLLERYLETGRLDYFGELYNRYLPLVYGLCLNYLREVSEAEDAAMDIFEELLPRMERARVREFRTWIYTVARNHCLQKLRKQKRGLPLAISDAFVESDTVLHLLDGEGEKARLEALADCIEALPEAQRRTIRLFFQEEKSYAEIADTTRYPLGHVKSYLQNGKRNLKNCLESKGIRA